MRDGARRASAAVGQMIEHVRMLCSQYCQFSLARRKHYLYATCGVADAIKKLYQAAQKYATMAGRWAGRAPRNLPPQSYQVKMRRAPKLVVQCSLLNQ
jgi:hypothetical protein